ncbi:MAG: ATP-binding cassette domain-containing protein, partial [Steroidobacteraceae bacterium]
MIRVSDLRKSFAEVEAVAAVSFTAENGEITGLLGPNGAGKSTTLRMIASLLKADDGRILIDDVDIAKDPIEARRRIGVLSHASGLYPHLTARENIRYFAVLHGMSRPQT